MDVASVQAREPEAADHWLWAVHAGTGRRAIAELALGVIAPAVGGTTRGEAAGVIPIYTKSCKLEAADHCLWAVLVGTVCRAIAEFAIVVITPAVGGTTRGEAAGVVVTGTNLHESLATRRCRSSTGNKERQRCHQRGAAGQ